MCILNIPDCIGYIKGFFSPKELIGMERVSRIHRSDAFQWASLGYANKNEFRQTLTEILQYAEDSEAQALIRNSLLNGRVNGQQAKQILEQDFYGKQWCASYFGIQAIALRIFTPLEIANMENYTRQHCLSKNGFELLKRGIFTSNEIGSIGTYERQRILSDKGAEMLINGAVEKAKMLSMTVEELDELLS